MKVRVMWLSKIKFEAGFRFVNVYGKLIGEVISCESLGWGYKIEAKFNEDVPLEVVLTSNPLL